MRAILIALMLAAAPEKPAKTPPPPPAQAEQPKHELKLPPKPAPDPCRAGTECYEQRKYDAQQRMLKENQMRCSSADCAGCEGSCVPRHGRCACVSAKNAFP